MADDRRQTSRRGGDEDHTGLAVAGGVVILGGGILALILLNRKSSPGGGICFSTPDHIFHDTSTGLYYLADTTNVLHPITQAGIAHCGYCTDTSHLTDVTGPVMQQLLTSCTVGAPVPNTGPCPAGPQPPCTPPGDPFLTWWQAQTPGSGARESVSIYYDLLGKQPPFTGGANQYPWNIWKTVAGGGGCGHYGMDAFNGTGFRIISDQHCDFLNRVNRAAGLPTQTCVANSCSACGCAVSSTDETAWFAKAGDIVLGVTNYVPSSSDLSTYWIATGICNCTPHEPWVYATQKILIASAAFLQRVTAQAAASTPPWYTQANLVAGLFEESAAEPMLVGAPLLLASAPGIL